MVRAGDVVAERSSAPAAEEKASGAADLVLESFRLLAHELEVLRRDLVR
jgi:hypothetical protein